MPWSPGQSGNPNGYSGPRNRRRHEVFEIIKGLDHKDALVTPSTLAHESQDEGIKMAAAAALARRLSSASASRASRLTAHRAVH